VSSLVGVAALAAACSDDGGAARRASDPSTTSTPAATEPADAGEWSPPSCDLGATRDVPVVEPVPDVPTDRTLVAADGTRLRFHWFPAPGATADDPASTVLMGPGWGLAGDTVEDTAALFGALGIGELRSAGYHVLTWDPRGFGASDGVATVNDAANEGRDVQALLDWVATQPEARLDGPGDPRAGMIGWSYGGGIQLVVAGADCRVDALVPGLAWHSLETSLYRGGITKLGWARILARVSGQGSLDPHIPDALATGERIGTIEPDDLEWFRSRGPGDAVDRVDVPTLFVQGTVDTLFTLAEVRANVASLRRRGVPTAQLWFCGGHGTCLTSAGDPTRVGRATLAWLDRYVRGDESVTTGPALDLVDQDGLRWTTASGEVTEGTPLVAEADGGRLELSSASAAGPIDRTPTDVLALLVRDITPAPATTAIEVPIDPTADALALGAPRLRLTYRGTTPAGDRPTRIFAQLVDDATGVVVGNQITPVPVELDGEGHRTEVELEEIAHHLVVGRRLRLQLVATTVAYATPRLGGTIDVTHIELELPTTTALEPT